jgi:hypothetical protein
MHAYKLWARFFTDIFLMPQIMAGVLGPYFLAHFVITPLVFYALFGKAVATVAFGNLLLAEVSS